MSEHVNTETLVEYLHRQLPAAQDAAVHLHVAECRACADALEAESRLSDLLRAHAQAEERELPPAIAHGIRQAVVEAHRPQPWLFQAWLRPALLAVAIVAGIFVGSYAAIGGRHSARASTIDAAYYLDDHAALEANTPLGEGPVMPVALTAPAPPSDQRTIPDGR